MAWTTVLSRPTRADHVRPLQAIPLGPVPPIVGVLPQRPRRTPPPNRCQSSPLTLVSNRCQSSPLTLVSWPVDAARTLAVSPAKSGATGRRRPGKTRLNRGQSKASAQFGVGRRGEKLKPETLKAEARGKRTEVRARRGSTEYTADGKGGPGTGKPDRPKHTIYRGRPYPKNTRYSGFQGLFCVSCLSLQRLGLSVGFGTGT